MLPQRQWWHWAWVKGMTRRGERRLGVKEETRRGEEIAGEMARKYDLTKAAAREFGVRSLALTLPISWQGSPVS
jgi:hypothetical protein